MAAGSRQQSRFIAMMSDYNRTVELVNAANTSASEASEADKYTVFYACYMEEPNSRCWYYYNGEWTTKNPRYKNASDIFTDRNVIKATGVRLQYYVISNHTGKSVQGTLWSWLKNMK